jgi:outer membrane receptor for ferrienterochelin and colicin
MSKKIIASQLALLFGALAFAAPSYSAENIELDDVVVTASRVAQPRESVIADVTVIDAEEIERGGQTTLVSFCSSSQVWKLTTVAVLARFLAFSCEEPIAVMWWC